MGGSLSPKEKDRNRGIHRKFLLAKLRREKMHSLIKKYCRKANVSDYENWLNGYLEKPDTKITHIYDYSLPDYFYVAIRNFDLPSMFGAGLVCIIVPIGINVTFDCDSDNNLYFMDGFKVSSNFVPFFKG